MPSAIKPFPLDRSFYDRTTLRVARELLGKFLFRRIGTQYLMGKIVETEAYIGQNDPACHAAKGRTLRNAIMFGPPGYAYIYFIYGKYYCLNTVTESSGFPAAVLIRAIEPLKGLRKMKQLRPEVPESQLTSGPGKLCQALSLDKHLNGSDLCGQELFITEGIPVESSELLCSSRIGIRVGKEHLWRFYLKNNRFVSQQ